MSESIYYLIVAIIGITALMFTWRDINPKRKVGSK